ncbi:MAG: DedA family protein [Planctomycetes bacterium]|nr:DedA family protein [Planctomycetota bacterium]
MDEKTDFAAGKRADQVSRWHLHRRLYDWILHWAETPYGGWALFVLAFAESSFFPVPPDVLLAPLTLGNRRKWFRFALSCSAASVVGGILGYVIGIFLWTAVGNFFHNNVPGFSRDVVHLESGLESDGILDPECVEVESLWKKATAVYPVTLIGENDTDQVFSESEVKDIEIHAFSKVGSLYAEHNWKIVAVAGFTPLPYKVITITAGIFKINFFIFCIASALSRSARFFLVAGLFGKYGASIKPFIDKYFNWLCLLFMVLLIGGFLVLKYL